MRLKNTELFSYTSEYLTRNGRPWFPVMGEFHYSRYPDSYWEESLYKMKACGVDVVSAYVIWIHHEEEEGEYLFSGCRDLHKFLVTAKKCGLLVFLRIGPWCHGEVRNGGFPDWLLEKDFVPRTNDENYLSCVKRYYERIFMEVKGLLHKDGGPVIGVQIENEYGHCGGLTGEEGEDHMRRLKRLAVGAGFDVPYYTATGWGGAVTGGMLPVLGGYCDAPWDPRITELEPSVNYVFTQERNDRNIGSDLGMGEGLTWPWDKFPYLTAELGGGIQVTRHRRPVAVAADIGAMTLTKLGCGANLLGYYMYHGGTNPHGKRNTLQESRESGYPNDLPEYSYDFNAPIREYGQISDTGLELKLYAMFLHDFGEAFCEMKTFIPEDSPQDPNDTVRLRSAVRRKGNSGYLFVNNYQRRKQMADHQGVTLNVRLPDGDISYEAQDIRDGDYFFYPFHLPVGEHAVLISASASPLCILHRTDGERYIFYGDREPHFRIEGDPGKKELIHISREDARHAWKMEFGTEEYLAVCNYPIVEEGGSCKVLFRTGETEELEIRVYPELPTVPRGFVKTGNEGIFTRYSQRISRNTPSCNLQKEEKQSSDEECRYRIELDYAEETEAEDVFLKLDYVGESLELFIDGKKEGDHFYTGQIWEIGLKRFGFPENVDITVHRLKRDMPVYLEQWPDLPEEGACRIHRLTAEAEYKLFF